MACWGVQYRGVFPRERDFVYFLSHALVVLLQYENAFNLEMLDVQFQLSRDLALELGVPVPQTVSLRDVPGTTRALSRSPSSLMHPSHAAYKHALHAVPHLVRNNITGLSVGVNPFSPAPGPFSLCASPLYNPSH